MTLAVLTLDNIMSTESSKHYVLSSPMPSDMYKFYMKQTLFYFLKIGYNNRFLFNKAIIYQDTRLVNR